MNIIALSTTEIGFMVGSYVSNIIGSTIVHEYSHIAVMRVLFPNLNPYMSCDGVIGLSTCYANWGGTPKLRDGLQITYETGYGIVSAAGPIAVITTTALLSMFAWKMRHSNEKISLLFAANAVVGALGNLEYCLSTLGSNWGDFASVELNLGVSHNIQAVIVGSVALGAAAMLTKLLFFSKKSNGNERKKEHLN